MRVCEIVLNQNNNNDITQLSRRFSKDHQEFEQYESISSGEDYIYVNLRGLNANYLVNLTKQVLRYFGYDPDRDFRIITEE
ncbi:MAG: hypothetical protein ACP5NR_08730 [Athalassotoga sp.]|uniref:hypothetical protein n=1 Tax=Athalassotoga sp. TaxID=2022597 RepID=UPI003D052D01